MKLGSLSPNIERSQEFKEQAFGIGDPVIIFDILRSKLYSNPILAIVREIASNARDANVEAGNADVPIEITLPNQLSHYFRVRDCGKGLSPKEIKEIFTQYGVSTKRKSIDQIGALGIGGKSPFSYTDNFQIDSITKEENGNVKRSYNAYIDETKIGKVAYARDEDVKGVPTDEHTGVRVSVSVKTTDERQFELYTNETLCYWNPLPKIYGKDFQWNKNNVVYQEENWSINRNSRFFSRHWVIVLIDKIPYKLNVNDIVLDKLKNYNIPNKGRKNYFVIDINNTTMSLTANREEIDYREDVVDNVLQKLHDIHDKMRRVFNDRISESKNLLEAYIAKDDFIEKFGHSFGGNYIWNDIKLTYYSHLRHNNVFLVDKNDDKISIKGHDNVEFGKNTIYLQNDTDTVRPSKLRLQTVFDQYPNVKQAYVVKGEGSFEFDAHLKYIGIKNLSEFPKKKVVRKRQNKSRNSPTTVSYELNDHGWDKHSSYELFENNGIYVNMKNNRPYDHKGMLLSNSDLMKVKNYLDKPIYGVSKRFSMNVDTTKWQSYDDAIQQAKDKLKNNKDYKKYYNNSYHDCMHSMYTIRDIVNKEFFSSVKKNTLAYKYYEESCDFLHTIAEFKTLPKAIEVNVKDESMNKLGQLKKEFRDKYPIMTRIMTTGSAKLRKDLSEYINNKG